MSAPTDYITKAGEFHSVVTPTSLVCAYNLDQNQLLIKITLRSKSPFDSMEPPAYRTDTPLNLAGIKNLSSTPRTSTQCDTRGVVHVVHFSLSEIVRTRKLLCQNPPMPPTSTGCRGRSNVASIWVFFFEQFLMIWVQLFLDWTQCHEKRGRLRCEGGEGLFLGATVFRLDNVTSRGAG
jgi:hypothetical protein